jgi:hypothetical protein
VPCLMGNEQLMPLRPPRTSFLFRTWVAHHKAVAAAVHSHTQNRPTRHGLIRLGWMPRHGPVRVGQMRIWRILRELTVRRRLLTTRRCLLFLSPVRDEGDGMSAGRVWSFPVLFSRSCSMEEKARLVARGNHTDVTKEDIYSGVVGMY